jgi:predicted AAA+ superfamily ATPase
LIENTHLKFALTGSSSRKLKRGGANLLAGRAFVFELFPFTHSELLKQFDLNLALQWGTLPRVWQPETSDYDRELFLKAYAQTYLKEEIQEEQLVRNLRSFYAFLEISAQMNGKILNYSKIAKDIQIDTKTVQKYFDILEETHIGLRLAPFHESLRKRQRENPKFYFFDIGVQRSLLKVAKFPITPGTYEYSNAFEHFVILEFHRLNSYLQKDFSFSYLQTHHNLEIDLVIERPRRPTVLCEIKSTRQIKETDLSSLLSIKNDYPQFEYVCLSLDEYEKEIKGVRCYPWQNGLQKILDL